MVGMENAEGGNSAVAGSIRIQNGSSAQGTPKEGRSGAPSRRDTRVTAGGTSGGAISSTASNLPSTGPWAGQGHIVAVAKSILAQAEAASATERERVHRATGGTGGGGARGDDPSQALPSTGTFYDIDGGGISLPLTQRDSFAANSDLLLDAYKRLALEGGAMLPTSPSMSGGGVGGGGGPQSRRTPSHTLGGSSGHVLGGLPFFGRGGMSMGKPLGNEPEGSLTGTSPFAMFTLEESGHSTNQTSLGNENGLAAGGDPRRTSGGGVEGGPMAKMGGKVADLPLNPEVQFELDWARDIVVYRDALLGAGATGLVYKGLYQNREVAIKVIIPSSSSAGAAQMDPEDTESMQHELQIMARLTHPNVVRVYGGCMRPPNLFVVEEIMVGDLATFIHRRPPAQSTAGGERGASEAKPLLSLQRVITLALHIIRGLVYLHQLDIIHRDLKPGNILMTEDGVAKISDFGLARCKYKTYLSTKKLDAGTVAYMAPECFNDKLGGVSTKCDIFSVGVILWELVTSTRPWMGLNEFQMIYQVTVEHARLSIPQDPTRCPRPLHDLIASCWDEQPNRRPTAEDMQGTLEALAANLT